MSNLSALVFGHPSLPKSRPSATIREKEGGKRNAIGKDLRVVKEPLPATNGQNRLFANCFSSTHTDRINPRVAQGLRMQRPVR